jgi:Peptidase family M28
MRKETSRTLWVVAALLLTSGYSRAQAPGAAPQADARPPADPPHQRSGDVGWRLAPEDQKYAAIDGARLKQYVADQTAISRRYRDAGHQFWGRIIGTSADAENAQWMQDKFKQFGLSDIHEQMFDLPPQWMPQSWSVSASRSGKTVNLETAQPTYQSPGTPGAGLDLEAVYVGQGSDAEFNLAPDVRGKAVFITSLDLLSRHIGTSEGAIKRAADRGAAAIFVSVGIPQTNYKTQFYPVGTNVPTFTLGEMDGVAIRDLIGATPNGPPARVKIALDVQMTPNLKSGTVWGTLPGMTDELVYVVGHRDAWFEGADDNGAGVATLVGLAEYFSKIPKEQRHRTIIFLGTTGHHNSGGQSGVWLSEHREIFAKAALLLNCEHTGMVDATWNLAIPNTIRTTNAEQPVTWYAGGTPKVVEIVDKALTAMGVPSETNSEGRGGGEIGRYYWYAPAIQFLVQGYTWHSDHETDETISAYGIAGVTRAYAKVIADTDKIPLKDLQRSPAGN